MSHSLNLIPLAKRQRAATRHLVRQWAFAMIAAASLVLLGGLGVFLTRSSENQLAADAIDTAQRRMDAAKASELRARRDAAKALAELSAARAVGRPPDWNILLGLLARHASDTLALDSLSIQQSEELTPTPSEIATLKVGGRASTQSALSQYIVLLEHSGLFDRVRMLRSSLDVDRNVLAFELEAQIRGGLSLPATPASAAATGALEVPR